REAELDPGPQPVDRFGAAQPPGALADDGHPGGTELAHQHAREVNPASSAALAQPTSQAPPEVPTRLPRPPSRPRYPRSAAAPPAAPISSVNPPPIRSPLSLVLPYTSGLPCSSLSRRSSRTSFSLHSSNAPSLKTTQFCQISTNAAPLCAAARLITLDMCGMSLAVVRATKVAPAPSASVSGLKGRSTVPNGELLVFLPSSLVGEACPLVHPYI